MDLQSFVEKCPQNLTGFDFYALWSEVMLNAITRCIQNINSNDDDVDNLEAYSEDFQVALDDLITSVPVE